MQALLFPLRLPIASKIMPKIRTPIFCKVAFSDFWHVSVQSNSRLLRAWSAMQKVPAIQREYKTCIDRIIELRIVTENSKPQR